MMDTRNKIIDQIFKILTPLRSLYKDEIEKVTNDLLIGYTQSLDDFINKYYGNTTYSEELVSLITELVNQGIIPATYLDEVNKKIDNTITYLQVDTRPLNVKIITFNRIQKHKDLANLDLNKFPISLVETKKEEVENVQMEIIHTNPNLAPVEIKPDENTQPDIIIPKEDNQEFPEFPAMEIKPQANQPNLTSSDVNETHEANEVKEDSAPNINITPTLEAQTIMSKDDIINSLKEEENINPDLKNTSQFGQLLQFPLNNLTDELQNVYQTPSVPTPSIEQQVEQPVMETPAVEPQNVYQTPFAPTPSIEQQVEQHVMETPAIEPQNVYQAPFVPTPSVEQQVEQPAIETPAVEPETPYVPAPSIEPIKKIQKVQQPIIETNSEYQEPYEPTQLKSIDIPTPEIQDKQLKEDIDAKIREEVKKQVAQIKLQVEQIRKEEKNNIVKHQNDYLNDAAAFIQNLNNQSEEEIYSSLRYLNDLKYMTHCIAHLNINTLERFYRFIEDKINSPQKEFMDGFIEKRIREQLPPNLIDEIEHSSKKIA